MTWLLLIGFLLMMATWWAGIEGCLGMVLLVVVISLIVVVVRAVGVAYG